MVENIKKQTTEVSSHTSLPNETSTPWNKADASESNDTTDTPPSDDASYVESGWGLLDKHILSGKTTPNFFQLLVAMIWLVVVAWLLAWAHYDNELYTATQWGLFLLKVGFITIVCLIVYLFIHFRSKLN